MTQRTPTVSAGLATALVTALAALLVTGCGSQEAPVENQQVESTTSKNAKDAAKKLPAAEVVERVGDSPGKPVAPIDVDYEVLGEPRPGEPVEIELKLRTALEGPVTVDLQPRDGLQMGAGQAPQIRRETIAPLAEPAAEPATERVVVVPPAEGRFYLSVLVSVATAEGEQIRAVSIPVQVGDQPPAMQQNGGLTTTEGETVRSLPAKESGGD